MKNTKQNMSKRHVVGIGISVFLFIGVMLAFIDSSENSSNIQNTMSSSEENNATSNGVEDENQKGSVRLPEYKVLEKVEHVSTINSENESKYLGDVLIKEKPMDIPPESLFDIARTITEKEDLTYSVSFYSTKDAYQANKDEIDNDKKLNEGYIGRFENGELILSFDTSYFEKYKESSAIIKEGNLYKVVN